MKLGTEEYLEEVKKRTNEDAEYRRFAKGENESYTLILKAEPERGVNEDIVVGYRLSDGEMVEIWEGRRETDFTLSAKYGVWVDILSGKLNAVKALSLRKLKVKGNFLKLLKSSSSTERWVEILTSIPTEFAGEYSEYDSS
ncbi:MAG: SCP2 sterol-binding domain-containing protein [Actinomycetota bacterium]|nr:SCP2 sterol-binding domain-containing protein [Actinomycetota bacterium]